MKASIFLSFFLLVTLLAAEMNPNNSVRDFWFNGAEINRYDLTQARYGKLHSGHAEFIFVTEPFLIQEQVKHERGPGNSTDVLKLNALRTFNTGIYSYRTMTSTFRPIDLESYPHALKTTTSVQDWCGQAFQQINRRENGWRAEVRSYFQNEGDQTIEINDVWLEDELWLLIRLDPDKLPIGQFQALPGSLYLRFAHKPHKSEVAVGALSSDKSERRYTITYPALKRELRIYFGAQFPHIIRRWEETDAQGTTTAILKNRIMNSYYWSENRPSDNKKRLQLGLEPIAD
jgi:hypothetical protein